MDDFNLEKLAKEIVVDRLKGVEDPPAGAGEVARKIVSQAVNGTASHQAPHETVKAVCRGLMSGMFLLEKDLPRTAVSILGQMSLVAGETHQDPAELMTWAMEGFAPIVSLAGGHVRDDVATAIDASYMGAGEVFKQVCETAGA
jgi:hypothetical protein